MNATGYNGIKKFIPFVIINCNAFDVCVCVLLQMVIISNSSIKFITGIVIYECNLIIKDTRQRAHTFQYYISLL